MLRRVGPKQLESNEMRVDATILIGGMKMRGPNSSQPSKLAG
jgi:hypothetical protein